MSIPLKDGHTLTAQKAARGYDLETKNASGETISTVRVSATGRNTRRSERTTDTVIHLSNGQSLRVRELSGGRADVETRNESGDTISSVTMDRLALATLVRTAGLITFNASLAAHR